MISPNTIKLFSIRNTGTEKAFSELGFRVFACDFTTYNEATYNKKFMNLLHEIRRIQPHIFYFFKDEHLPQSFFQTLKAELPNTKFVMRHWDQRGNVPDYIRKRGGIINSLILNNRDPQQYKMYQDFGIKQVHTLYNPVSGAMFTPLEIPRSYEVFFGGSHYNRSYKFPLSNLRSAIVKTLRKKFKVIVHGIGWDFPCGPIVRRSAYSDALQVAHVNIGINHYNIHQYYSERTIQNPASGRLHITHYIPGMEKDFGKNHTNVVWFNSVPECVDVVNFYLKNAGARGRIEAAGRKLVLKKFGLNPFITIFANILYRTLGYNVPRIDY